MIKAEALAELSLSSVARTRVILCLFTLLALAAHVAGWCIPSVRILTFLWAVTVPGFLIGCLVYQSGNRLSDASLAAAVPLSLLLWLILWPPLAAIGVSSSLLVASLAILSLCILVLKPEISIGKPSRHFLLLLVVSLPIFLLHIAPILPIPAELLYPHADHCRLLVETEVSYAYPFLDQPSTILTDYEYRGIVSVVSLLFDSFSVSSIRVYFGLESLASMMLVYLIASQLFDRRTAVLSSIVYGLVPSAFVGMLLFRTLAIVHALLSSVRRRDILLALIAPLLLSLYGVLCVFAILTSLALAGELKQRIDHRALGSLAVFLGISVVDRCAFLLLEGFPSSTYSFVAGKVEEVSRLSFPYALAAAAVLLIGVSASIVILDRIAARQLARERARYLKTLRLLALLSLLAFVAYACGSEWVRIGYDASFFGLSYFGVLRMENYVLSTIVALCAASICIFCIRRSLTLASLLAAIGFLSLLSLITPGRLARALAYSSGALLLFVVVVGASKLILLHRRFLKRVTALVLASALLTLSGLWIAWFAYSAPTPSFLVRVEDLGLARTLVYNPEAVEGILTSRISPTTDLVVIMDNATVGNFVSAVRTIALSSPARYVVRVFGIVDSASLARYLEYRTQPYVTEDRHVIIVSRIDDPRSLSLLEQLLNSLPNSRLVAEIAYPSGTGFLTIYEYGEPTASTIPPASKSHPSRLDALALAFALWGFVTAVYLIRLARLLVLLLLLTTVFPTLYIAFCHRHLAYRLTIEETARLIRVKNSVVSWIWNKEYGYVVLAYRGSALMYGSFEAVFSNVSAPVNSARTRLLEAINWEWINSTSIQIRCTYRVKRTFGVLILTETYTLSEDKPHLAVYRAQALWSSQSSHIRLLRLLYVYSFPYPVHHAPYFDVEVVDERATTEPYAPFKSCGLLYDSRNGILLASIILNASGNYASFCGYALSTKAAELGGYGPSPNLRSIELEDIQAGSSYVDISLLLAFCGDLTHLPDTHSLRTTQALQTSCIPYTYTKIVVIAGSSLIAGELVALLLRLRCLKHTMHSTCT